ncbi:hypothetical protein Bca52824_087659 [Brassica carinata]|uniref:Uncharacterized protein n=1 Tax=Brassica carinata TaxID=52824 RepID=A0A8X7TQ27_BRACI|nr:hypothetical protein Bca52824_087659 [Brassica carinata]
MVQHSPAVHPPWLSVHRHLVLASPSGPTAGASSVGYQYANFQNQVAHHEVLQQQRQSMVSSSNHVSTHLSYPNTVVSDGFLAVDESRDGGRGGGYAPSSEMNSNSTTSWLQ